MGGWYSAVGGVGGGGGGGDDVVAADRVALAVMQEGC